MEVIPVLGVEAIAISEVRARVRRRVCMVAMRDERE
jgi:hypothetical protein